MMGDLVAPVLAVEPEAGHAVAPLRSLTPIIAEQAGLATVSRWIPPWSSVPERSKAVLQGKWSTGGASHCDD